jgi:hypothetical protein
MTDTLQSRMSLDEMNAFLDREFPQIHMGGRIFSVEAVGYGSCRMRMAYHERNIRPGGTL